MSVSVLLRGGPPVHPHIYSKRILRTQGRPRDGDIVQLCTREGRPCGFGFFHSRSLIAVRVLTYDADVYPNEAWLRERVRSADTLRRTVLDLPAQGNAWRVAHAEGDGLSGLVVDRYGETGVAVLFSLGWQRRMEELRRVLAEEAGLANAVFRADARAATLEGLELPPPPRVDPVEVEENGVRYRVDPAGGHKSGFFLDQRENRLRLAGLARGRTVFDGMTYTGGFALSAARAGARSVRAMDLDEEALARGQENAKANGLEGAVAFEHGDVFDALRGYVRGPEEARPEVLIVDPSKWARDRAGVAAALAKYRDLNRLAMQAVRTGGVVVTCSCSGLVSESAFLGVVRGAAMDVRRDVRFLSVGGAAPDHPVSAVYPEGRYLKCVFLVVGAPGSGPGNADKPQEDRGGRRPQGRDRR